VSHEAVLQKARYPSRLDDDPYLAFLADGGYMVETMARALFPDGRELQGWENPEEAARLTQEAIEGGDGTFFEATILQPPRLARIDILRRKGRVLELIEVKSTSLDPGENLGAPFRGSRGGITSEWRPDLEDVTYQAILLERAFPQFEVRPSLRGRQIEAGHGRNHFRQVPHDSTTRGSAALAGGVRVFGRSRGAGNGSPAGDRLRQRRGRGIA